MALIIKPRSLGLLTKTERRPVGASFVVSAFGLFDLAEPSPYRLEGEQAMWLMVAKELPPGAIFDLGMPKPTAEVLVGGHAAAPGGEPVQRMGLAWAIGDIQKRLLVTGDRMWRLAGATAVPTEPQPFVQMPLTPQRCFGGEGHSANPAGTGFRAQERLMAREQVALPNIETPEIAIRSIGDAPQPPRFGPMAVDAKERLQYSGTYDEAWTKTLAPALAEDADPRLFLFAPQDQRLPGYLDGNEGYGLRNFSADAPEIQQHLPGFRVRCFIGWTDPQKPIVELPMRIDTLWFFAGARRGVMTYRGATPVEDIEAADIADVMLAYERMTDEPRPLSHYLEVRALRTNPETAYKYAFSEHQLAPGLPQSEIEAREAKRRALAEERRRKQREDMQWGAAQMLANSGIPKELWPEIEIPETEDYGIPMPLPEEIESGELDLAGLLDAIEELQVKQEAKLDETLKAQQPMLDTMREITSGDADPGAIDKLLAMLNSSEVAAQLDAEIAQLPVAAALPPETAEAAPALEKVLDWRQTILDGPAQAEVDEVAQFALARARFLGLPEGRPLERVREQLTDEHFSPPDLPEFEQPEPAAQPGDMPKDLEDALRFLETTPLAPPQSGQRVREAVAGAEAEISALLPNLVADGASALTGLIALGGAPQPAQASSQNVVAQVGETLQQARSDVAQGLDDAEAQLIAAQSGTRRLSPEPLKPDEPLTPDVARRLGELVEQQFHAGIVLAGRDFAGADLSGRDLAGADLSGAFLENTRLDGARLAGANLTRATLCGASLTGADLSHCDLTEANLSKVSGRGARFSGSRLIDVTMLEIALPEASFDGAELSALQIIMPDLAGASFAGASISNTVFIRGDLARTDWRGAALHRVQIADVPLAQSRFAQARLHDVTFVKVAAAECDFSETQLSSVAFAGEVDLRAAIFTGASGLGVSFVKADLAGADFSTARFDNLCFVEAGLSRSSFRLANLKRALFSRNDVSGADFFAANLLEAQFNRADLTGASLRAANLFGADLNDATLYGADLSRANLTRTVFAMATDVG